MLKLLETKQFDDVFAIMEESFPRDEHRPYDEQKELLRDPHYRIYVIDDKNGKIKSFVAVWQFEKFVYVEHLATSREFRNCGLGGVILDELNNLFDCKICLEVEPPTTDLTKRRIAFYERNGFYLNEYPYVQPPISKGRSEVNLLIMSSDGNITKDEFDGVKTTLYKYVYKVE